MTSPRASRRAVRSPPIYAVAVRLLLYEHDEQVVTLGGLRKDTSATTPRRPLVKLRQFAALLAKLVSARRAAYRDERETFEETLRQLSYERIIPRRLRTSSILSGRSERRPA
jgi:hypothetical protein